MDYSYTIKSRYYCTNSKKYKRLNRIVTLSDVLINRDSKEFYGKVAQAVHSVVRSRKDARHFNGSWFYLHDSHKNHMIECFFFFSEEIQNYVVEYRKDGYVEWQFPYLTPLNEISVSFNLQSRYSL